MQLDKIQSLENKLNSASIIERTNILCEIIDQRGSCSFYDEEITQLQHALQCATLAKGNNESDKFITASLFHDLGHMLTGEDVDSHDFLNNVAVLMSSILSLMGSYFFNQSILLLKVIPVSDKSSHKSIFPPMLGAIELISLENTISPCSSSTPLPL